MVNVITDKGKVRGIQESDHQYFLGIPYAKPPVGVLRFNKPQPMENWDDNKDATKFRSISPQGWPDNPPINQSEDEDCLYLNIWTPNADKNTRPVMVWIHGGGFMTGAGSRPRINGARLAIQGDVVVITFNYRLGILGFLNLPGMPPNIGLQDQIVAIEWVKENIQQFGGDPQNITIFGESAGGVSVAILLTTPGTTGLFHKAIIESGAANLQEFGTENSREGAEKLLVMLKIKPENISKLRQVPLTKIMRMQKRMVGGFHQLATNPFQPWVDGEILLAHPLEIMQKSEAINVPIIIGFNKDELGFLSNIINQVDEIKAKPIIDNILTRIYSIGTYQEKIANLIEIYKKELKREFPKNPYKYVDKILSDSMFAIPVTRVLEAYVNHQLESYCYIFTYASRVHGAALHTIEIPFVFGNIDTSDAIKGAIGNSEVEKELTKKVMKCWVAFARTGNPNQNDLPKWLPYDLKKRSTMMLGEESKLVNDPLEVFRKAWENII